MFCSLNIPLCIRGMLPLHELFVGSFNLCVCLSLFLCVVLVAVVCLLVFLCACLLFACVCFLVVCFYLSFTILCLAPFSLIQSSSIYLCLCSCLLACWCVSLLSALRKIDRTGLGMLLLMLCCFVCAVFLRCCFFMMCLCCGCLDYFRGSLCVCLFVD